MIDLFKGSDADSISEFSQKLCLKLAENHSIYLKISKLLHSIAQINGFNNWHSMKSHLESVSDPVNPAVRPVLSNKILESGTSIEIKNFVAALIELEDSSGGPMLAARTSLLSSIIVELYCELRDSHRIEPSVKSLNELTALDSLLNHYCDKKHSLSRSLMAKLAAYLNNPLGLKQGFEDNHFLGFTPSIAYEQHDHICMHLNSALSAWEKHGNDMLVIAKPRYSERSSGCMIGQIVIVVDFRSLDVPAGNMSDLAVSIVEASEAAFQDVYFDGNKNDVMTVMVSLDRYGYTNKSCKVSQYKILF